MRRGSAAAIATQHTAGSCRGLHESTSSVRRHALQGVLGVAAIQRNFGGKSCMISDRVKRNEVSYRDGERARLQERMKMVSRISSFDDLNFLHLTTSTRMLHAIIGHCCAEMSCPRQWLSLDLRRQCIPLSQSRSAIGGSLSLYLSRHCSILGLDNTGIGVWYRFRTV